MIRAIILQVFFHDHVSKSLASRKGKCKMCGKCCEGCIFILPPNKKNQRKCSKYNNRPIFCRKSFPIDELDQKAYGLKGSCGYYWN